MSITTRVTTAAVCAALVAIGASPATAAPAPLPFGDGVQVVMTASAAASRVQITHSAFEALASSDRVHLDQILKNLATGAMD